MSVSILDVFWPIWGPPALAKVGGRWRWPNIQQNPTRINGNPLEKTYIATKTFCRCDEGFYGRDFRPIWGSPTSAKVGEFGNGGNTRRKSDTKKTIRFR